MSGGSWSLRMWKCSPGIGVVQPLRGNTLLTTAGGGDVKESRPWCGEVWKEHLSILRRLHHLLTCLEKTSQSYLYSPCSWKLSCLQHTLWRTARQQRECVALWRCSTKLHSHFYFVSQHFPHASAPLLVPLMQKKKNLLTFPFYLSSHLPEMFWFNTLFTDGFQRTKQLWE